MRTGEYLDVGARIRTARLRKALSQSELARAVGADQRSISRWERGLLSNLNGPRIITMCRLLGISADELLGTSQAA